MAVEAYLNFKGNCREAVEHYAKVFDTEVTDLMTFGGLPPNPEYPLPQEAKDWIMHARIQVEGSRIMFSDVFPGMPFVQGNNVSLAVVSPSRERIESYFNRLKEGGKVGMELQETFWSKLYGNLTDKFGTEWQFNLGE